MIKEIDFATIKSIWQEYLWPNRKDIMPMSNMRYQDTPYIAISQIYTPTFFAYFVDNKIAGVNSGHCSSRFHFRSRGLFVFSQYRGKGIGTELLKHVCQLGKTNGMAYCWSLPRKESLSTYLNAGFECTSDFFKTETSELNCYVSKQL
jgi:GNAT superfamily N-acetyltransferase